MIFKNTDDGWKKINAIGHNITKSIKVSATNILFKSENEQLLIIENFAKMLNSLTIPIQILCTSQDINPNDWKLKIHNEQYYEFLKEKISQNQMTQKEFKIIVSYHDETVLDNTLKIIQRCLKTCHLEYENIEDIKNIDIIPHSMTQNYVKIDNYYCKTLYTYNWPHMCSLGWLNDIYNNDTNINISMFIHPVSKQDALKYLNKKLAQNVSNSVIEDEDGTIDGDQYDENIASAILMRDELYKNNGKFFYMSYYVTVKSQTVKQLSKSYDYIKTVLEGMDIETYDCYLLEDEGYKCTQPLGLDLLNKKYNFTTQPLKYFFPFITSNIIDKEGVLIGENLLNSGLVFLNPFKYNSALMFVIGKVGGGKTYLVQLLCLRLLFMGVQVDIWDREGEYLPLKTLSNLPNLKIHHYKDNLQYKNELRKYLRDMDENRTKLQPRFLIIDEFWKYLDDDEIVKGINDIALTGRKKYQGLCVISQMIEHLMESDKALSIVRMASIKALMQMEPNAAKAVQRVLDLTDQEVNFLISAQHEGILFAGSRHVQFKALASEVEDEIITTDPVRRLQKKNREVELNVGTSTKGFEEAAATRTKPQGVQISFRARQNIL
jgi:hypothetical protein